MNFQEFPPGGCLRCPWRTGRFRQRRGRKWRMLAPFCEGSVTDSVPPNCPEARRPVSLGSRAKRWTMNGLEKMISFLTTGLKAAQTYWALLPGPARPADSVLTRIYTRCPHGHHAEEEAVAERGCAGPQSQSWWATVPDGNLASDLLSPFTSEKMVVAGMTRRRSPATCRPVYQGHDHQGVESAFSFFSGLNLFF